MKQGKGESPGVTSSAPTAAATLTPLGRPMRIRAHPRHAARHESGKPAERHCDRSRPGEHQTGASPYKSDTKLGKCAHAEGGSRGVLPRWPKSPTLPPGGGRSCVSAQGGAPRKLSYDGALGCLDPTLHKRKGRTRAPAVLKRRKASRSPASPQAEQGADAGAGAVCREEPPRRHGATHDSPRRHAPAKEKLKRPERVRRHGKQHERQATRANAAASTPRKRGTSRQGKNDGSTGPRGLQERSGTRHHGQDKKPKARGTENSHVAERKGKRRVSPATRQQVPTRAAATRGTKNPRQVSRKARPKTERGGGQKKNRQHRNEKKKKERKKGGAPPHPKKKKAPNRMGRGERKAELKKAKREKRRRESEASQTLTAQNNQEQRAGCATAAPRHAVRERRARRTDADPWGRAAAKRKAKAWQKSRRPEVGVVRNP